MKSSAYLYRNKENLEKDLIRLYHLDSLNSNKAKEILKSLNMTKTQDFKKNLSVSKADHRTNNFLRNQSSPSEKELVMYAFLSFI